MEFSSKFALVTGASRGIGKAIAKALCDNGAFVYLVSRDAKTLSQSAMEIDPTGKHVKAIPCDITSNTNIKELFKRIEADEVYLDILVNAAGIAPASCAEDTPYDEWKDTLNTNLGAVFSLCQNAFLSMKHNCGGKIINIASILGNYGASGLSAYCASKGGVIALTKQLATEWARYNINVNAIGPGYILTDMTKGLQNDPILNQKVINRTPLGRFGKVEDVANTALFLACNSSDFITGAVIPVDGGMSAALV